MSWTELPDELMLTIFRCVAATDLRDLCTVSIVCKRWNQIAEDELFWRDLFKTRFMPTRSFIANVEQNTTFIGWKASYRAACLVAGRWKRGQAKISTISVCRPSQWIRRIQICPWNDNLVMVAHDDHRNNLALWDTQTCQPTISYTGENTQKIKALQFDEEKLIGAGESHEVLIWNTTSAKCLKRLSGHSKLIQTLEYKGDLLATGSADNTIRLWSIERGECLDVLKAHTFWVWTLIMDDAVTRLYSASLDGDIIAWDLAMCKQIATYNPTVRREVSFSRNDPNCLQLYDHSLVCGYEDGVVRFYDVRAHHGHRELPLHSKGIYAMQLDNTKLVTACFGGYFIVTDIRNGQKLFTSEQHEEGLYTLKYTPWGNKLMYSSKEKLYIWDFFADSAMPI